MYHACIRRVHRQTSHQGLRFQLAREVQPHLLCQAAAESQPYAILYKDGLLSLQAGSGTDPSHGEVLGKWAWDGSSSPWYDERARVRFVVATDRVAVSNGYGMFRDLANCRSVDLSRLDVSGASDLSNMFHGCSSLASLDLSGWGVSNASSLSWMFSGCSRLQSLDLSGWNVPGTSDLSGMFSDCSSLNSVTLGTGCGRLVWWLPSGPWYDAEGKAYDCPPAGVAGTFTRVKPEAQALAADDASAQDGDASAPAEPSAPEPSADPDAPAHEPSEPSDPEIPAEPGETGDPSEPEVPNDPSEPELPAGPADSAVPAEPDSSASGGFSPDSAAGPGDAPTSVEFGSDAGVLTGEEPLALAA